MPGSKWTSLGREVQWSKIPLSLLSNKFIRPINTLETILILHMVAVPYRETEKSCFLQAVHKSRAADTNCGRRSYMTIKDTDLSLEM